MWAVRVGCVIRLITRRNLCTSSSDVSRFIAVRDFRVSPLNGIRCLYAASIVVHGYASAHEEPDNREAIDPPQKAKRSKKPVIVLAILSTFASFAVGGTEAVLRINTDWSLTRTAHGVCSNIPANNDLLRVIKPRNSPLICEN